MPTITQTTEVRDAQRATWNKFSVGWKKWDAFVMNWLSPVGEKVLEMAKLTENARVLDVATGTGEPGLTAARRVPKGSVLAVDVAEDMVKIAKEKGAAAGLKNFNAEAFDGIQLPGGNYDAVLARFGLMFFPDVLAGLKEIKRVMKPGAHFAASVWLSAPENPWAAVPGRIVHEMLKIQPPAPDAVGIFRCAAPGYTENLFEQAGFSDIQAQKVTGTLVFRDADHYWEYLTDVIAPVVMALSNVDADTREKVHQAVVQAVTPFVTSQGLRLPWNAKVTAGRA